MTTLMKELISIIEDPFKSLIATISGTLLGYTPKLQTIILNTNITSFDRGFQHTVWFLTSAVAVFAIISGVQKQIDRYKKNHKDRDMFNNLEEDED